MNTLKELKDLEKQGLITLRPHNDLPLSIANYTPTVQYDRLWDSHPLLVQCRGLIVDKSGNVVGRPFEKFFNYEEHLQVPTLGQLPWNLPYKVWDKLDGSLGIVFYYEGVWRVSTRGSFHSEQADKANRLLKKYDISKLRKEYTYLVEILYPENRIVVNYGDTEELVLIANIRTEDGVEPFILQEDVFPIVTSKSEYSLDFILKNKKEIDDGNSEGFVIQFADNTRVKIKFDEYVRLHKVLSNLTEKGIWELLKEGHDIRKLYQDIPDEYYDWVKKIVESLNKEFNKIKTISLMLFQNISSYTYDRKAFALEVLNNTTAKELHLSGILFSLYDNKEIDTLVWDLVKPVAQI